MSEEEFIKDIKETKYNEENVEKLLYELENDTGNYSCYDNAIAIIYYKDLYQKEKEKNEKLTDKITELVFYYNKNALDIEQNNMFKLATSKEQIEIDMNRAIARAFKKLLEERN